MVKSSDPSYHINESEEYIKSICMRVKIEDPEIYQKETEKRNIQIVLIIQKVYFDISRWNLDNFLNNMICSQNIQNQDWVGITEIVVYIKSD